MATPVTLMLEIVGLVEAITVPSALVAKIELGILVMAKLVVVAFVVVEVPRIALRPPSKSVRYPLVETHQSAEDVEKKYPLSIVPK